MKNVVVNSEQQSPLERFMGQNTQVLNNEGVAVSKYVRAELLEVCFPNHEQPEEGAHLYLFPIDDHKFCMELLYLQYAEGRPYTAYVYRLQFLPGFFDQYTPEVLMARQPFRFDQTTDQPFSVCSQTRMLLEQLQKPTSSFNPLIDSLQLSETATQLLRRALQCITLPFTSCQVPACRFLAFDSEREKVAEARRMIEDHIDQPMTIRELSRKVAMNECYLKKGFKALVGRTIHEYQQELRIAKAKVLLQQHGQSVSDVANTLGYSSISHFSTAFKKATGMKPCELLA